MSKLEDRVIELKSEDLNWPFEGKPYFSISRKSGSYHESICIEDAFPCYPPNKNVILEAARHCEKVFPLCFEPFYYLLPFEMSGRTNGAAFRNDIYSENKKNGESNAFAPYIVLSGKRIPIHIGWQKTLLTHEYGHLLDNMICYKKGYKGDEPTQFDLEYAQLRGIDCYTGYGGKRWDRNIGEIITDDARICVFGVDPEHYPHPVSHPLETPAVREFWYKMELEFAYS